MKKKCSAWLILWLLIPCGPSFAVDLAGVEVHGFVSQGYLLSDENNYLGDSEDGSFQFNEVGINFSKELSDDLRVGMQIFSRDLGEVGNNQVEFDWAYGELPLARLAWSPGRSDENGPWAL